MASHSVKHGGQVVAVARERSVDYRNVLDFSANINPLGPSRRAIEAIRQRLDVVQVYPDETAVSLIRCLSERLQLSPEHILAGNGATELLYFWLRTVRPRKATLVIPTFSEYRKALESVGAEIQTIELRPENDFRLPIMAVDADVVILTNPNNPTGSYVPPEEMLDWIGRFHSSIQVFVDEAFVEFTAQPSLVRYIERFPNLWILRSMTKFYAIPGLRLGYLVGGRLRTLLAYREPWQVNSLAELAGIVSLEDRSYEEATLQLIQRERIWLWKQLRTISSVRAFQTHANFFLARCDTDDRLDRLIALLLEKNTLIRDCRNVEGLHGPYFRFAIKTRADNRSLLSDLRRI